MLTYATVYDYLLSLGLRHLLIANSELTYSGEASSSATYPLVLVETDVNISDVIDNGRPTGAELFTVAIQVLDMPARADEAEFQPLLIKTKRWADELIQQLRDENWGQLMGANKLALPGVAGSALAVGWRVELTLKIFNEIDRNSNAARFAPAS